MADPSSIPSVSAPASSSSPASSSAPAIPSSSSAIPSSTSSDPVSSSAPVTPSSSSAITPSSSSVPSSSTTPTTSSTTSAPLTTSAVLTTSNSLSLQQSTDSNGGVVTVTHTFPVTQSVAPSSSAAVRTSSKGFLQNKGAVAAVFTIVGLVAAGIIFALVTNAIRRRRAKRFDREIAEEAKRAPPPVFVDDEDYNSGYGSGGYGADSYGQHTGDPYAPADAAYPVPVPLPGPGSDGGNGTGTPSNYMYPSGYSDLGFSDASSHGTYAQPPMSSMEGAYQQAGFAGYGAQGGAYEMGAYPQGQTQNGGRAWDAVGAGAVGAAVGAGVGAGYGAYHHGEDAGASGYPPPPPANSSGSDLLTRNKSGAARSLVDSHNASSGASHPGGAGDLYADGYVSHYQARPVVQEDPYGGYESHHGHVGTVDDEGSDWEEGEGDGRRVLKVANE